LKNSKYISQALVVGDARPYVAALITLDQLEIEGWARRQGMDGDLATLSRHPDVHALIQSVVDEVNAPHSRFEQVKRFIILPRDFSIEEGEVTPTMKLRRKICQEHFAGEIDDLYSKAAAS
jgi:long-chain acyl-CoA synthetase